MCLAVYWLSGSSGNQRVEMGGRLGKPRSRIVVVDLVPVSKMERSKRQIGGESGPVAAGPLFLARELVSRREPVPGNDWESGPALTQNPPTTELLDNLLEGIFVLEGGLCGVEVCELI